MAAGVPVPAFDAPTGATTLTKLDEVDPAPELLATTGLVVAWGSVAPVVVVVPVALTGAYTFARVPVACGLELRPTTTAAGVCRSLPLPDDESVSVPLTGARAVTRGRPSSVEAPAAVPDPWLPVAAPAGVVPRPTVTVNGDVAATDVGVVEVLPAGDPEVPAVTGALIHRIGPTVA
jgi:hypothetical protein